MDDKTRARLEKAVAEIEKLADGTSFAQRADAFRKAARMIRAAMVADAR